MNIMGDKIHQAAFADLSRLIEYTARSHRDKAADDEGWIHEKAWRFVDGQHVTLSGESYDDVMFPASAGYDLITFEIPEDGDSATFDIGEHVHRDPVIGWCLAFVDNHFDENVEVITTAGNDGNFTEQTEFGSFSGIALPDGRVVWRGQRIPTAPDHRYGKICASFDEWIGLVREVWTDLKKREAEKEHRRAEAVKQCPDCGRHNGALDDELPFQG